MPDNEGSENFEYESWLFNVYNVYAFSLCIVYSFNNLRKWINLFILNS